MPNTMVFDSSMGVPVGSAFPERIINSVENDVLEFSGDQTWEFKLYTPVGWTGTPTARVIYAMASATTGEVDIDIEVEVKNAGDTILTRSFDTVNSSNGNAVPGTAGDIQFIDFDLTNHDSSVAERLIAFRIAYDQTGSTAAGNFQLLKLIIEDAA